MKVVKIKWDTDGANAKSLGLPQSVDISDETLIELLGSDTILKVEDYDTIVDWISEEYGWRVYSCNIVE